MNDESTAYSVDKRWLRRSFDRASTTYDASAVLQTEVRNLLLQRLDLTDLSPRLVVDAGAGTGHAWPSAETPLPKRTGAGGGFVPSGCSTPRAGSNRGSVLSRDYVPTAERLPLPDGSVDLIVSNFMLQWSDLDVALAEFRRVLAPRGFLTFTTLGARHVARTARRLGAGRERT